MKTIIVVAAALLPAAAAGAELHFQCPERYLNRPVELLELPSGWRGAAAVRPELLVSGGGVIGGPLKLSPPAELRGEDVKSHDGWSATRYPVGRDGETWAYCAYGQGGEIQLFRRVDGQGRNECIVRSIQPKSPASMRVEIACK